VAPGEQDCGGGDRESADDHGGPDSGGRGDQAAAERAERFGTSQGGALEAGDPAQQVVGHLPLAHGGRGHVEQDTGRAAGREHRGGDDHRPMPPGPSGLRYLDYFLGLLADSGLGTGAKLELITMISGFATMYGATQAAPAGQLASAAEQAGPLARAAARGRYPHLVAALATAGQPGGHADIFGASIERLIDLARLR
jgi:hypothetical protein